jgi:hypothetical protein
MQLFYILLLNGLVVAGSIASHQKRQIEVIPINHPIIVSQSPVDIDGDGTMETVQITLEKGRRANDMEPWCGNGEKWEGQFSIRVRRGEQTLSTQSLNGLMYPSQKNPDEISLWAPEFRLVLKDYNKDGQVDFNVGQFSSCRGHFYWLFTIQPGGAVVRLAIKGKEDRVFISPSERVNSTEHVLVEGDLMKATYYDNYKGKHITESYKWDGKQFVLVKEEAKE